MGERIKRVIISSYLEPKLPWVSHVCERPPTRAKTGYFLGETHSQNNV
jgi:hypothetical protein